MRPIVGVLACLGAGVISLALADPPAPAQQQPATTSAVSAAAPTAAPPAATPAASATPAAATAAPAAKPAMDPDEKRLLSEGYKPEMRGGQKIYCRREPVLGSRLETEKHCGTVDQLKLSREENRDAMEKMQRTQRNPAGS